MIGAVLYLISDENGGGMSMEKNWMALLQDQNGLGCLMETNQASEQFGLALTRRDAELILKERGKVLREMRRVEFGEGIIPQIIYEFCDSAYIDQDNYVETLLRLQEIFYLYKNEMLDEISDSELVHFHSFAVTYVRL